MAETSLRAVGRRALEDLEELVGCPAEGLVGVQRTEQGWLVTAELLEVQRVPETTDVLASYEVSVNAAGEVESYHRVGRYLRAQVDQS
ncbi:gas vesicle protein GvpO [Nocardioides mesophilus]|uniref:Gas vesicle protein n=1 Tax=Nocardioides mesophilus TaxID=433659 RepID=A0A7G9R7G8_9ACTN|nr:gas vesicle protein GvpO [Nocardioides mesophilus]QNN51543.1 gas vesicle protein [Nocardioides mesophilus]